MAALTVSQVVKAGLTAPAGVTPTASTGDTFACTGKEVLVVVNNNGSSINVTVNSTAAAGAGLAQSNNVVAVANGATKYIGPFEPSGYADSTGVATVICSAVSSVTIAVLRLA